MELQETARQIAHLQGLLEEMREKYADQEDLYEIYSQSIRDDVRTLAQRLRTEATQAEGEVDLWLTVQSESATSGHVSLDVATQLLDAFSLCVKYAASILKGDIKPSGSFTKDVARAGSFDLVAIEAGSTRFGLRHSVNTSQGSTPADLENALASERRRRDLGRRAVRTLILSLRATVDDSALDDLVLSTSKPGARLLIDRVERLFPKNVDQLNISGPDLSGRFSSQHILAGRSRRLDEISSLRKVKDPSIAARRGYRAVAEASAPLDRSIQGTARLAMLDVDLARIRLVNVQLTPRDEVISSLSGYVEEDVSEMTPLLGARVEFRGMIKGEYGETPQVIEVQEMTAAEP
jgi:hypothetical protein